MSGETGKSLLSVKAYFLDKAERERERERLKAYRTNAILYNKNLLYRQKHINLKITTPLVQLIPELTNTRPLTFLTWYRHFIKEVALLKLVLWAQTSPPSEMMRTCTCFSRVSKMPALT